MTRPLPPKDCLLKMIESKVEQERNKWDAGMHNQFIEWESLQDEIELYFKRTHEDALKFVELTNQIERLKNQLKRLGVTPDAY